jgi:hypothetical protein
MPNKEAIDQLRALEAFECEQANAETDQQKREAHFLRAAMHASCMVRVMRQTEAAMAALMGTDDGPLYQVSMIVTREVLPAALSFDSRWQTDWSLPCLSRFAPTSTLLR